MFYNTDDNWCSYIQMGQLNMRELKIFVKACFPLLLSFHTFQLKFCTPVPKICLRQFNKWLPKAQSSQTYSTFAIQIFQLGEHKWAQHSIFGLFFLSIMLSILTKIKISLFLSTALIFYFFLALCFLNQSCFQRLPVQDISLTSRSELAICLNIHTINAKFTRVSCQDLQIRIC